MNFPKRVDANGFERSITKRGVLTRLAGVLALAAATFLVTGTAVNRASAAEPIKLGILPSATGGGASIGAALTLGVELAASEINKAGGINGREITIIKGDTQSNPTTATSEAKRLVEREKVDLLIGPLVSQEVVPTVAVTTEAKIVQFTNAGTTELNTQNGPYHFSLNTSSATVAEAMVSYLPNT